MILLTHEGRAKGIFDLRRGKWGLGIWGLCSARQHGGTQTSSLRGLLLTQCPLTVILKAYRDPPLAWKKNCLIQSTPWSPCTKTCGLGISVRVNNDNGKCEMRKDRRLCLLRPCEKSVMRSVKVATLSNSILKHWYIQIYIYIISNTYTNMTVSIPLSGAKGKDLPT